ncbi:MAG TPA: 2-C-methyl-D-erythritol 4-phosphate cytidylyltransferase, partial [Peptostreptococcaceae bacterium]|nr:2-C-methyl-D-erythritol 4-phosphate cytidylyltransferase [Peptostreptococcaceae bacterium]
FNYKLLMNAYENAYNKGYYGTDDAMLVEYLGQEVKMIMGSYENIKITTSEDIGFGENILKRK